VVAAASVPFARDNRAESSAPATRISAIPQPGWAEVVWPHLPVGRAVFGTVAMVRDLLDSGPVLLLLARLAFGKTRRCARSRVLRTTWSVRVVVIEQPSNEIAGENGGHPHPAIGQARRMQGGSGPELQARRWMIEGG